MSFFYDFCKYFDIEDMDAKTTITTIIGYGIMVVGKIKIKDIQETSVTLISNKDKIMIDGDNLKIKSISNGEIIISGKIAKIEMVKV